MQGQYSPGIYGNNHSLKKRFRKYVFLNQSIRFKRKIAMRLRAYRISFLRFQWNSFVGYIYHRSFF